MGKNTEKSCVFCAKFIPKPAKKCYHCGYFQSGVASFFDKWSRLIASLAIVAASSTYFLTTYNWFNDLWFWEESVSVAVFSSKGSLVVGNRTSEDIYLVNLLIEPVAVENKASHYQDVENLRARVYGIQSIIPANNINAVDFPTGGSYTNALKSSGSTKLLNLSHSNNRCVNFTYYATTDPSYQSFKRGKNSDQFVEDYFIATLLYYSVQQQKYIRFYFDVVGVVTLLTSQECRELHPDFYFSHD